MTTNDICTRCGFSVLCRCATRLAETGTQTFDQALAEARRAPFVLTKEEEIAAAEVFGSYDATQEHFDTFRAAWNRALDALGVK